MKFTSSVEFLTEAEIINQNTNSKSMEALTPLDDPHFGKDNHKENGVTRITPGEETKSSSNLPAQLQEEPTEDNNEGISDYFKSLLEGTGLCGDSYLPFGQPEWFDVEKFHRGRQFQKNYSACIKYAQMMSLLVLFTHKNTLEVLIFTDASDSPYKAYRRYLSTALRVQSWYEEDIFSENSLAHKNIKAVRAKHEAVRKRMLAAPEEKVKEKTSLEDREATKPMWTSFQAEISEDFHAGCPAFRFPRAGTKEIRINQTEMAVTQFGFVGLVLLFPKMFGIHKATDEDLEGFVHYWRTIGYLLGIQDQYNLCNDSLAGVKTRCNDMLQLWMLPGLGRAAKDWHHMSRCLIEGISYYIPGTTFEVVLLHLAKILSIPAPHLAASLTFGQKFMYNFALFLNLYLLRLPGMVTVYNWLLDKGIEKGKLKSPDELHKLEAKVYPYYSNHESYRGVSQAV